MSSDVKGSAPASSASASSSASTPTVDRYAVLVDGSKFATLALQKALQFKRPADHLWVITVCQFSDTDTDSDDSKARKQAAQDLLQTYIKQLTDHKIANIQGLMLAGSYAAKDQVFEFANEQSISYIFVGNRGLNSLKRTFLGSFSSEIVEGSPCTVVVVKSPPPAQPPQSAVTFSEETKKS